MFSRRSVEVVVPLLERSDCVLIVVDAQPGFSGSEAVSAKAAAGSREVAGWLAGVACGGGSTGNRYFPARAGRD